MAFSTQVIIDADLLEGGKWEIAIRFDADNSITSWSGVTTGGMIDAIGWPITQAIIGEHQHMLSNKDPEPPDAVA